MLSTATDLASFPAETLQKAENGLLQLNGFLDSTEQAERIGQAWRTMVYEEAASDLESGNLDSAAEKMRRVHPFEDSASYLTYIKAMLLKSQGQYAAAANGFAALGSFLDSSEMRSECSALDQEQRYVRALGLLARGDLEEAEALFSGPKSLFLAPRRISAFSKAFFSIRRLMWFCRIVMHAYTRRR